MSLFTYAEFVQLKDYIEEQLINMEHLEIAELSFNNRRIVIQVDTIPIFPFNINQSNFSYKINIRGKDGYYLQYQEYYYRTYMTQPIIEEQLYKIEDFDDIFNVLEDIFDRLRPRDEY